MGGTLNKDYLNYALKSGCFLFLFDGYDEIVSEKKDIFFKELDAFCDKYSENYYIISSRPYTEFIEFQRFTVLSTLALSKDQAIELIEKIEYDESIKRRFLKRLENELYDKHTSFASNPLLLNIMLITFDNYAEIPEKLHLFYENAFEALYSKHDATKAGYKRDLKSKLTYDSLKKVFSYFCFISYAQGKLEFTSDEMKEILNKIDIKKISFDKDDLIFDLTSAVCVLYREGIDYRFVHRSFQEYFTAVFLKELPDESLKKIAVDLIKKDAFRLSNDGVFKMLRDMAEERFEQNVLLPILEEYEGDTVEKDKYDFYFKGLVSEIRIEKMDSINKYRVGLTTTLENGLLDFIISFKRYYSDIVDEDHSDQDSIAETLFEVGKIDTSFKREKVNKRKIEYCDLIADEKLYSLVRQTWIGTSVYNMSILSDYLRSKRNEMNSDLSNLLL